MIYRIHNFTTTNLIEDRMLLFIGSCLVFKWNVSYDFANINIDTMFWMADYSLSYGLCSSLR